MRQKRRPRRLKRASRVTLLLGLEVGEGDGVNELGEKLVQVRPTLFLVAGPQGLTCATLLLSAEPLTDYGDGHDYEWRHSGPARKGPIQGHCSLTSCCAFQRITALRESKSDPSVVLSSWPGL